MAITVENILNAYPDLVQHLEGDRKTTATQPCSQDAPLPQGICYVADEKYLERMLKSDLSVLVVHQKLAMTAQNSNKGRKALLVTKNTYLAMALINEKFFSLPFLRQPFDGGSARHTTAIVARSAAVGQNVILGPGAVIGENVVIGDGTFIGAHTVVEANTKIGRHCFLHPQVYIGHTCTLGDRVEIQPFSAIGTDGYGYAHDEKGNHYRIPHYGPVIIEDDVQIGANVNIDRGTFDPARIGAGTKIDNHCHLGHNVTVGKNCLITAGFIVAGSTKIGDNCVFAGRVSVNGHIEIVSGSSFGPKSGVSNDVRKPGAYAGYPIQPFKEFLRTQASLSSLPRLRRNLARVMKHLGIKDGEDHQAP